MASDRFRLGDEALRWCCDARALEFETTAEVEPVTGIIGQEDAVEALSFGLEIQGDGLNVFIRGLTGTGRMSLVRQLLEQNRPRRDGARDRCYVHNFAEPARPILLSLQRGRGPALRHAVDGLITVIEKELPDALGSQSLRARRSALDDSMQQQIRELGAPFEDELRANDLALVPMQVGPVVQPVILPLVNGEPVAMQDLGQLRSAGQIDDAQVEAFHQKIAHFSRQLGDLNHRAANLQASYRLDLQSLYQAAARDLLSPPVEEIKAGFEADGVAEFLDALVDDLISHRLDALDSVAQFARMYRVNVLHSAAPEAPCPVVVENSPSLANLLGSIERELTPGAVLRSDHLMIQGGALLRADGGFLVLDAREVLNEPGAWKSLMRTLRTRTLEIVPAEVAMFGPGPLLKPDPIDLDVKVILVGDPGVHQGLDALDPDFPNLFKILADFETTIERDAVGVRYYAGVLARIAREEGLAPFTRQAVAALCEQGARIAARRDRLTTRFGRLADIAREAAFLGAREGEPAVGPERIREAIARGRRRAELPARRFRKSMAERSLLIETDGAVVGQINGLAVVQAGPLTYGFPTRITATIGPGTAGTVNIEREANLSGAIHTKGFYILEGLLRHLLRTSHPLAFSASIAFEQSYGGIDGDSASGAEMCCLMSALTEVPLDQGIAMTGAIDQHGHIQPIGAVSEKVEGFFEVCRERGLTGRQGVLIPRTNAGELMLEAPVVEACRTGRFSVLAVDTIHDALAVLTGRTVPPRGDDGYPAGSLLDVAVQRASAYWTMASQPLRLAASDGNDGA